MGGGVLVVDPDHCFRWILNYFTGDHTSGFVNNLQGLKMVEIELYIFFPPPCTYTSVIDVVQA